MWFSKESVEEDNKIIALKTKGTNEGHFNQGELKDIAPIVRRTQKAFKLMKMKDA